MRQHAVRRILLVPVQLFILSVITFAVSRVAPGDPVINRIGQEASAEQIARLRELLGLNDPLIFQYWDWFSGVITLDFGRSAVNGQPVNDIVFASIGPTVLLATTAILAALLMGVTLGAIAAWHRNSVLDYALTTFSFVFVAIPSFWSGLLAIMLFAVMLRWLPSGGIGGLGADGGPLDLARHLILPAAILALDGMASIARFTRSSLIEVSTQDYLRTARAKGLTERLVLRRHALPNGLLPVVTILGLRIPQLVGGAVIVETVFSWPGLGRTAVQATYQRDYPITMAIVMVVGLMTILGNLAADLAYGRLDPRIER